MYRKALFFSAVLVFIALCHASARAETYYVAPAPDGSDTNAGTEQAPFATIQKAADVAVAGDTVIVTPGTYAGAKFSTSGTPDLPIVISGMDGAIVASPGAMNSNGDNLWVRDASYVTIEGFDVMNAPRAGIAVQGEPDEGEVHGVVVRNNNCHDNTRWGIFTAYAEGVLIDGNTAAFSADEHGIYVSNSADNPVITHNEVHDNFAAGIQINADPALDGDGIITSAIVDANVIYGNGTGGAAGINLASVRFSLVTNNLLYDNHATGIALWDDEAGTEFGSKTNRIFNNTIVQAVDGRFAVSLLDGSTANSVQNNILLHLGPRGAVEIDTSSLDMFISDYNVITPVFSVNDTFVDLTTWRSLGLDLNSFTAPLSDLFVNVAADDYELKPDSAAIDVGRPVTGVPTDIRGVTRPQGSSFDIGAYEYTTEVPNENHPPVAEAGSGQTVEAGATVFLDGSASSDPDGDALTYSWQQLTGLNVALVGANTATPQFVAPDVSADVQLTFSLTVMDGQGGSDTDSVSVLVKAPPPLPKIFVLRPVGGESWKSGNKKKIRWLADPELTGDVRIEISHDGGATFETAIASVPVQRGKKRWKVTGPATTQALIRVVLISDPRIFGVSPNVFTIR